MNCAQVLRRLAEYSAGLIEGRDRAAISDHIASCAECAAALAEYRAIDDALAGEREEAGEDLVAGVMDRVRSMPTVRRPAWLQALDGIGPLVTTATALPAAGLCVVVLASAMLASLGDPATPAAAGGLAATLAAVGAAAGAISWAATRSLRTVL